MKETEKKIIKFISDNNLLSSDSAVLCAVSGGRDSMCMLCILKALEEDLHIKVCAAHYNHGIRGEEANRDEKFVRDYCQEHGTDFVSLKENVPALAEKEGMSVEEAGRHFRYAFLKNAAQELGCDVIATAHNMNDNAETVLFNLSRGAGLKGLSGIPVKRENIIRPLLCLSRAEIDGYIENNSIPFVDDSSNLSDIYSRNIIRHKVIPVLESFNSEAVSAINSAASLLKDDDDALRALAESFIKENGADGIDCSKLCALPRAVSSRVIRSVFPYGLSCRQVDSVLSICRESEHKELDLPGGGVAVDQGRLYICPEDEKPAFEEVPLAAGQKVNIPELNMNILAEETVLDENVHGLLNTFYIKCDEIQGRLIVSPKRDGDSMRISGRGCSKSLKKLFLENHINRYHRLRTIVIRDDKGILSVPGLAISERAAAKAGERVLKIIIENL